MDNFRDGSGFDPLGYAIASTPRRSDEPEPRFTTAMRLPPLPEHSTDRVSITLQQLQQFYAHPIRTLLRKRAEIDPWRTEEPADEIPPTELDGLQRWHIGNRMLRAHLAGADLTQLAAVELRRGELPPPGNWVTACSATSPTPSVARNSRRTGGPGARRHPGSSAPKSATT